MLAKAQGYERLDWPDDPAYPLTDFERRFLAQGLPIWYLVPDGIVQYIAKRGLYGPRGVK